MLKQIVVCLILFTSPFIFFSSCEKDPAFVTLGGDIFYIFNNSVATIYLVYEEEGSFEEVAISPSELLYVGEAEGYSGKMSNLHPVFESEVFKVYSKEKLIYRCLKSDNPVSNVTDTNYYTPVIEVNGYRFIKVAPLFKWCGNELCEDQCGNVNMEED